MDLTRLKLASILLFMVWGFPLRNLEAQTASFSSTDTVLLSEANNGTAQVTVVLDAPPESYTQVKIMLQVPACNNSLFISYSELSWREIPNGSFNSLFFNPEFNLTFAPGQTSATFEIKNTYMEFWGGISYQMQIRQGFLVTERELKAVGNLTTRSDITPGITFSDTDITVNEGAAGQFTAMLSPLVRSCNARFLLTVTGGSATPGVDYAPPSSTPISREILINSWISDYIAVIDDTEVEGTETIELNMTVWVDSPIPGEEQLVITSPFTFTILNDDLPVVTVESASVVEGPAGQNATLTFPVSVAVPSAVPTSFAWRTQSASAMAGSDFVSASGTITIPAGQTTSSISVVVQGDALVETNEIFTLVLSSPNGLGLPSAPITGTILDDDTPKLTVGDASILEGNSGTTAMLFPVSLSAPLGRQVSFSWSTESISAAAGIDFVAASGTVSLPAGQTESTISVSIVGDTVIEATEAFQLLISNTVGTEVPPNPIGTIENDDLVSLTVSPSANLPEIVQEGDTQSTLDVGFTRSEAPTGFRGSVDYTITSTGTRVSASSGTVRFTFFPTKYLYIPIRGNLTLDPEPDEVVTLTLSNPVGVDLSGGSVFNLFRIVDDDPLGVTVTGGSVSEGNAGQALLPFTATLSAAHYADVSFTYSTTPGTAAAGQDFPSSTGVATIPAGSTSVEITVPVNGDTTPELDETVSLTLSGFSVLANVTNNVPGIILTDDSAPAAIVAGTLVTEASGADTTEAWFSVSIPAALNIPYICSVATRNGTAEAGSDYRALAATPITFAPGETRKWVAITVTAAPDPEKMEEFYLDVTAADSGLVQSATCVIERLRITAFWRHSAGLYIVRFPSGLGQRYVVDRAEALIGPWVPSSSVLNGSGFPVDQFMFSDTDRGYFRVRAADPLPPGIAAAGS